MKPTFFVTLLIATSIALGSCGKKGPEAVPANDSTAQAAASTAPATASPTSGKYKIKSAVVTSSTEMPSLKEHTTETLYFDNYGAREARETVGDVSGIKIHTLAFTKDGYLYTVNYDQKTCTRMKGMAVSADMDYSHLTDHEIQEYHIQQEGTEQVAGKTCDVYSMNSSMIKGRVSAWNGIPMHTQTTVSGMQMNSIVTAIDENAAIPESKFEVPEGFTIKDL